MYVLSSSFHHSPSSDDPRTKRSVGMLGIAEQWTCSESGLICHQLSASRSAKAMEGVKT